MTTKTDYTNVEIAMIAAELVKASLGAEGAAMVHVDKEFDKAFNIVRKKLATESDAGD